jgi:GTPase SAR1 family protein
MRYALFVTGPAGAGKSTFCQALLTHMAMSKRTAHLVNLDPAADPPGNTDHAPAIDIRELVPLEDVMEELGLGPNGGLVHCFE